MNTDLKYFNEEEKKNVAAYVEALRSMLGSELAESDFQNVYRVIVEGIDAGHIKRDKYGINPVERSLCTACLVNELIAPDRNITIATLLYNLSREGFVTEEQIKSLNLPYEVQRDGFRVAVKNTEEARNLILARPELFVDFEISKGKMDDVFLSVTGKKLVGGN